MITQFKIFENESTEYYWQVPLDPLKLRIALKKIGMTTSDIDSWCDMFEYNDEAEYVFMFYSPEWQTDTGGGWSWSSIDYEKQENDYDENQIFMGIVDVEDWEINAEKYNI